MKRLLLIIGLAVISPLAPIACKTPPSERVVQVQTLKAVGHTAESAVASTAQLYAAHLITAQQALRVNAIYDNQFQPAYRIAVNAVNANLDSVASPELAGLAAQLAAIVASYQSTPTP